jgi:glycosyltransferase involved in cell wall biosynthesis
MLKRKNRSNSGVYILTQSYLTSDGGREQYSGLQRYVRELVRLVKERGLRCVVLQKAIADFQTTSPDGAQVIGLKARNDAWGDPVFNYRAHQLIPADSPVIYCLVELIYPHVRERSIALQHGVWWDGQFASWKLATIRALNRRALRSARGIICVDTNYINWCLDVLGMQEEVFQKCHYVPNFVNPVEFDPGQDHATPRRDGQMTVLFPRRCEEKRGASLFLQSAIRLWKRGLKFHAVFCGWGSIQREISDIASQSGYREFVEVLDVPFDGMRSVYLQADIVVIPTLRHEGTSLSCIEALQMGKPVITTFVGGLPNLVIPGCNGEVVSPTVEQLSAAMARLLDNQGLRQRYGCKGRAIAESFSIEHWKQAVWNVISNSLLDFQFATNS